MDDRGPARPANNSSALVYGRVAHLPAAGCPMVNDRVAASSATMLQYMTACVKSHDELTLLGSYVYMQSEVVGIFARMLTVSQFIWHAVGLKNQFVRLYATESRI
jgi:hypothetical protein